MANPAELLFDIFTAWRDDNTSAHTQRNDESLETHRRAVRHLEAIEAIILALKAEGLRTAVFERQFTEWCRYVFCYPNQWTAPTSSRITDLEMAALENLIGYADQVVLQTDKTKFSQLILFLDAVELELQADSTLVPAIRLSALSSIAAVRQALANIALVGDWDFKNTVERLLVTLLQVEMASKNPAWKSWKEHFVWPFIYDASKYAIGWGIGFVSPQTIEGVVKILPGL